ncbi:MAG TPA: hypothetical protein VF765_31135 [Polyangiaceae bacterium]
MAASPLTKARLGSRRLISRDIRPLAAAAKVFRGSAVGVWLSGAKAGFYDAMQAGDMVAVGIARADVDNTAGSNGTLSVEVDFITDRWIQLFDNDTGTAVVVADRESLCWGLDDHTATASAAGNGALGVVYDVTSEGVWVQLRAAVPQDQPDLPLIQSGTSTLVAGTKTISGVTLTANSRILLTMKDPGSGAITGFGALDAPAGSRNTSAGTFVVNAIDDSKAVITTAVSTFDYLIIG